MHATKWTRIYIDHVKFKIHVVSEKGFLVNAINLYGPTLILSSVSVNFNCTSRP